ncbi:MAG: hypothetical protein K2Y39_14120 [Candidatus Obscuribacterales bacterium]|nr:hypothetical protein [Candidatus Obscuribacterales bacterium]
MEGLDKIISVAIEAIDQEYFLLPIRGGFEKYRERVYCYELYHQIKARWPKSTDYRLNGENTKQGHPYFENIPGWLMPDFVVHVPGFDINYCVMEVKSSDSSVQKISEDFDSLETFLSLGSYPYKRGILIIFGEDAKQQFEQLKKPKNASIEVWLHYAVHKLPVIHSLK